MSVGGSCAPDGPGNWNDASYGLHVPFALAVGTIFGLFAVRKAINRRKEMTRAPDIFSTPAGPSQTGCRFDFSLYFKDRLDPSLSPADNSLKLMQYLLTRPNLSSDDRTCLLYCMDALRKNPENLFVPRALLESNPSDAAEDGVDSSVYEWLVSDFTSARTLATAEHLSHRRASSTADRPHRSTSADSDTSSSAAIPNARPPPPHSAPAPPAPPAAPAPTARPSSPPPGASPRPAADADAEGRSGSPGGRRASGGSAASSGGSGSPMGGGARRRPPALRSFGNGILFECQTPTGSPAIGGGAGGGGDAWDGERGAVAGAMAGMERWGWDVFALAEAAPCRVLQVVGWRVLCAWGMDSKFGIEPHVLRRWLTFVESLYTDTEFHNATHAADVLQTVHSVLAMGAAAFLEDIEILALLLSAMVHDVGHDGFSNAFHKHHLSDRALMYNDQSIQENFHVYQIFSQMAQDPEINIFRSLPASQFQELRRLLILLVLGTDMSKHFLMLKEFTSMLEERGTDPSKWAGATDTLMAFLLHACDISGQAKPRDLAIAWTSRCFSEFYRQGDYEKQLGLPTSPLCDRCTTVISSAQTGFIKFVLRPTYDALARLLPEVGTTCIPLLEDNLAHWRNREASTVPLLAAPSIDVVRIAAARGRRRSSLSLSLNGSFSQTLLPVDESSDSDAHPHPHPNPPRPHRPAPPDSPDPAPTQASGRVPPKDWKRKWTSFAA